MVAAGIRTACRTEGAQLVLWEPPPQDCLTYSLSVSFSLFLFFKFIHLFYLFLAALGLRCCTWAFPSCSERGLLFVVVRGLLIVMASLLLWSMGSRCAGFSSCGTWAQ